MRSAIRITDEEIWIRAEGITCPATVYALADTHLTLHDERDQRHMKEWLEAPEPGFAHITDFHLIHHLKRAEQNKADLVLAAGDILHFPSHLNAELAGEAFRNAAMPVLMTPGNHDWFFPGEDDSASGRRNFSKVLLPVTGKSPSFSTHHLAGVTFVAVDNSSRRVTRDQAREASRIIAKGEPTVVMMHIPASLPTLREPARLKLGEVDLMNDPDLAPAMERELGDDESTTLFMDALVTAPNLLAIVCGHLHIGREDSLSPSCVQIGLPAGYRDGYRLLRFQPWE